MTFNEYQEKASTLAEYPDVLVVKEKNSRVVGDIKTTTANWIYPALGLAGEAGEVSEKIKKIVRNDKGVLSDEKVQEIKKELGDVLWYIQQLAKELGLELDDVAQGNLDKLFDRKDRGVIASEGDNR